MGLMPLSLVRQDSTLRYEKYKISFIQGSENSAITVCDEPLVHVSLKLKVTDQDHASVSKMGELNAAIYI